MEILIATYLFSAAVVVAYIVRLALASRRTSQLMQRLQSQSTDILAAGRLKKTA